MSFAQRRKISDFLFSALGDMKIKDSLLVIFQNDSLFKVLNLHVFYSWFLHLFLGKFCSLNVTQFHSITYSLFKPKPGEQHPNHSFYRRLYPSIIKDIEAIESNWRCGKHNLQRINCRSENSKGVYCLQYDDTKIGAYV